MTHAVNPPGAGETQCGTAGAYILDVNICSSYYIDKGTTAKLTVTYQP